MVSLISRQGRKFYRCGECKSKYYNLDSAETCCMSEDEELEYYKQEQEINERIQND